jgi:hypothetical protein
MLNTILVNPNEDAIQCCHLGRDMLGILRWASRVTIETVAGEKYIHKVQLGGGYRATSDIMMPENKMCKSINLYRPSAPVPYQNASLPQKRKQISLGPPHFTNPSYPDGRF